MTKKRSYGKRVMALVLAIAMILTALPQLSFTVEAEEPEDGLILYYNFVLQNSYATEIGDVSGNGNAGHIQAVSGSPEGRYQIENVNLYGRTVKALKIPGGEDGTYLELPDGILNGNEAVTISMWVKLTTDTGYQRIFDIGRGGTSYLYLLSDGGNDGFKGYASGITTTGWENEKGVSKPEGIDKNRWVLATVVMDGTKLSLYENGTLIGTEDTGISVNDLGETTGNYIGYSNSGMDPTTEGQFAEVKIYNKALSAEEIAAMYTVTDEGIVSSDKEELTLGDMAGIKADFNLPLKGASGSTITWESKNSAIAIEDGKAKVTRPQIGGSAATGKLTATITYKDARDTKEFDVTVLPMQSDAQLLEEDIVAVRASLPDMASIVSPFAIPSKGQNGSVITWVSANPAIVVKTGRVKVTRPAAGAANATGKLTATFTIGSESRTVSFDTTVVAQSASAVITSVEEVKVTTQKGHSPQLPNYVTVTYADGSVGKLKAVWPVSIDSAQYGAVGKFNVEGSIVDKKEKLSAEVTVTEDEEAVKNAAAENFDLTDISLDGSGTILTENRDRDLAYLKLLDKDRMLYNFYYTFGLTDKIKDVEPLGGWDEPTGLLRGHSTGHYISALALAYASTGDAQIKENLDYVIHQMREMQKLSKGKASDFKTKGVTVSGWSKDPEEWGEGYISAYSPDQFALLEQYTPYGSPNEGIWAPYYTLHKLFAGFLDTYKYTGNEEALELAKGVGDWVYERLSACSQEQLTKMWDMYIAGEFGGMNESLATLYKITGEEKYLDAAKLFDNTNFFDKLAVNVDDIQDRHANQHIPQIIGAMETYEATVKKGEPEVYYYDVAKNFWEMTVSRYAYSIGGVGTGEKFTKPYQQANYIKGDTNCETCAAYNMLKLTKMLNNYEPENAEYMDYYERTLYNQILASQTPNVTDSLHNGTTYMLPIGPGARRSYGDDYSSFTCCHGTGMENHVKYQEAAYEKTADSLYVSLYLPSTVTWEEMGVEIAQETAYPSEDTKLTVSALGQTAKNFNMKLRVPYWATNGFTVTVNGEVKAEKPEISTYVTLENIKAGDVIQIHMPWTIHLDKTPDKLNGATLASVMYGPFVMAAANSSTDWQNLMLSENLSDSIKVTTSADEKLPSLSSNGFEFAPMFAKEFASAAYHTYFKVTIADDGNLRYPVTLVNNTPKLGEFEISTDYVQEDHDLIITAKPNEGYKVKMLLINGEPVTVGEDNTYTVEKVDEEITVEGSFGLINPPVPDPSHLEFTALASSDYTAEWENVDGVNRDWEPTKSNDGTGKGWGNYYVEAGTEHYLQYTWETEVTLNKFEIYWYDDGGGTRVPSAMKVMYRSGAGDWKEAEMLTGLADASAVNQYNTIELTPVTATEVRLVMTIREESGATGIYRWKVTGPAAESGEITAFNSFVEEIKAKYQESVYTAASWKSYALALSSAQDVISKGSIVQTVRLEAGKSALEEAALRLKVKASADSVNKLISAVASVKSSYKEEDYTSASWKAFLDVLETAEKLNTESSQEEVDAAQKAVENAAQQLVKDVAGAETVRKLTDAVSAASGYKEADYTPESWKIFNTALEAARKVMADKNATRAQVENAQKALADAIAKLAKKQAETEQPPTVEKLNLTLGLKEKVKVYKKGYTYETSNKKFVTVKKGVIQGIKRGKATVTVKNDKGQVARIYTVTVKKAPKKISKVTPAKKTLKKGKTVKLKVKLPKGTASYKLTFTSSNKKVATVDANGIVKAKKKGKATITVKTFNKKTKKVKITVK